MLKLVASLVAATLALAPQLADARRMPVPEAKLVFEIDHANKPGVGSDLPETHFALRADGSWLFTRTGERATTGTLPRAQLARIRQLLRASPWRISHAEIRCKAFAMSNTVYRVNGRAVFTQELCGSEILDRTSGKKLARVLAIVQPLLPSA